MEFGPDPPLYALSLVIAFVDVITTITILTIVDSNVIIIIINIVIIRTHY